MLLGFAATDFVITMTLSAADAAKHAVENPFRHDIIGEHQVLVTLAILLRYWEWTPEEDVRPLIFLMSD